MPDGSSIVGNGTTGSPLAVVGGPSGAGNSDGVTLKGTGLLANPYAIKQVQTDATLSGSGTVAMPLGIVPAAVGPDLAGLVPVDTDESTLTGNGTSGTPLAVVPAALANEVPVATDGVTATGNGTTGDPISVIATAGTTIYFNVKAYGPGDGGTVSTQDAANAANALGGGTVYFPDGTYSWTVTGSTERCVSLPTGVTILGQSRSGTVISLANGQTSGGLCRLLFVANSATNWGVDNICFDGNSANNTDASLQSDGIFISLSSSFGQVYNVEVRNCSGTGIVVHQNTSNIDIELCYIHDNLWIGTSMGNAGGQSRITWRKCDVTGNAGGIHIEIAVDCNQVLIDDCFADAPSGATACQVVGGTTPVNFANDVTVQDSTFSGYVQTSSATNVTWINCDVTNADASVSNPPNHAAAYRVTGQAYNVKAINCVFVQQAAGTSPQAAIVGGDTNNNMSEIYFVECEIEAQGSGQDGIYVQQAASVYVHGGNIKGNSTISGAFYGVHVNAKVAPSIGAVHVDGVHIVDFPIGIGCESGSSSLHVNSIQVCNTTFEAATLAMTAGMSLDVDGHHAVQQATCVNNDLIGLSTMFATYPNVPMLIGGNRGAVEILSVATSPASVVTAPIGSQAIERDNGTTWINATGLSSGWHSVNVT